MAKLLSTTLVFSAAGLAEAYTAVAMQGFMFKNIDPIVVPGQYKSHLHTFFGSDAVTLNTTALAELKTGCTTAENMNDQSVYWTPSLLYTGGGSDYEPLYPMRFSAYYENIADAEITIPENFALVVGNSAATTQAQTVSYTGKTPNLEWFCEGDDAPADKERGAFPTTTCSTHLQHLVYFHDCVNPDDITEHSYLSTDNLLNTNRCPTGQKRIPRLRMSIRYDLVRRFSIDKTVSHHWL